MPRKHRMHSVCTAPGPRPVPRSTTASGLTSRSVTAFRSRSVSAEQSRMPAPENSPTGTPGDHSKRAPTARSGGAARIRDRGCRPCRTGVLRPMSAYLAACFRRQSVPFPMVAVDNLSPTSRSVLSCVSGSAGCTGSLQRSALGPALAQDHGQLNLPRAGDVGESLAGTCR